MSISLNWLDWGGSVSGLQSKILIEAKMIWQGFSVVVGQVMPIKGRGGCQHKRWSMINSGPSIMIDQGTQKGTPYNDPPRSMVREREWNHEKEIEWER